MPCSAAPIACWRPACDRIATGFPSIDGLRPTDRARATYTGNPVRPAMLAAGEAGYRPPASRGPIELLVLGGSQGARIFSELVPAGAGGVAGAAARRHCE